MRWKHLKGRELGTERRQKKSMWHSDCGWNHSTPTHCDLGQVIYLLALFLSQPYDGFITAAYWVVVSIRRYGFSMPVQAGSIQMFVPRAKPRAGAQELTVGLDPVKPSPR